MPDPFSLFFTDESDHQLSGLKANPAQKKQYKAVVKALKLLSANPRHPGLNTHEFTTLKGPNDEKVFEAYAEQATPGAYRIFWCYGPKKNQMTIIAIIPHP